MLGLPALRALRRRFPAAEITLVAPAPQGRIATWEPLVDRLVDFGEPALAPLIAGSAQTLPSELPFPEVACVWLRDHATVGAAMSRLGVRRVIGCSPLDAIPVRRHVARWLQDSLAPLGVAPEIDDTALTAPLPVGRKALVLHPGSGSVRKNWPGWAAAIGSLHPLEVTVVAGQADAVALDALLAAWPSDTGAPTVLSDLSLERLAAILAGASLYLGNDSGVSHLAAALSVPSVVVFGPTDPEIWRPIGPSVVVLGGTRVTTGIFSESPRWPSVEEVASAARAARDQAE